MYHVKHFMCTSALLLMFCSTQLDAMQVHQSRQRDWSGPVVVAGSIIVVTGVGYLMRQLIRYEQHQTLLRAQQLLTQDRVFVQGQRVDFSQLTEQNFTDETQIQKVLQWMREYAIRARYEPDDQYHLIAFANLLRDKLSFLKEITERRKSVNKLIEDQWTDDDKILFSEKTQTLITQLENMLVFLTLRTEYQQEQQLAQEQRRHTQLMLDQHRKTEEQTKLLSAQRNEIDAKNRLLDAQAREASARAREINERCDERVRR